MKKHAGLRGLALVLFCCFETSSTASPTPFFHHGLNHGIILRGGTANLELQAEANSTNIKSQEDLETRILHEKQDDLDLTDLQNFNSADETEVLKARLALAQAEIGRLKQKIHKLTYMDRLYFASGVLIDLPEEFLNGWTNYYKEPYSHGTMFTDLQGDELGTFILVGAKFHDSSKLAVAAMGRRTVLLDAGHDEVPVFENGVYWYLTECSFGFADSEFVELLDCDVAEPESPKRLSWFIDVGWGGYRAGSHLDLYRTTKWEKVLYYA